MKEIIHRNIKGKKVLLLFILTNLVYILMLTITIPKVMNFSNGMKLLDMMPAGYDTEYVNSLFSTLGEEGRDAYLYNQIPVDMIYPLLFGITYCLVLAYFLKKLNKLNTSFFYLSLLPLVAGISDYMENIGILTMLIRYPDISILLVSLTNIFTILKSVSTTIYFVALLVTIIIFGIKSIRSKRISANNS